MDIRKQMLSYIERTSSLVRGPLSVSPLAAKHTARLSQSPSKSITPETQLTPSRSRTLKISSNHSSNRSSRFNSPARNSSPAPRSNFRDQALRTINDLLKVRTLKLSKNIEIVAREVSIIKKLKALIESESKGKKVAVVSDDSKKRDERVKGIMKESAEELLKLENRCKEISEENEALRLELEGIMEKMEKVEKPSTPAKKIVKGIEQWFRQAIEEKHVEIKSKMGECSRKKSYLKDMEKMAEKAMKKTHCKDVEVMAVMLMKLINAESDRLRNSKEESLREVEKKKKLRVSLENKISALKN